MDLFDDYNDYKDQDYNKLIAISRKQWRTMLITSIAIVIVLLIAGYFVFAALLNNKIEAANQAYIDAVNNYKRVYYLPEDYSTAPLSVTSQRLDSVLEIYCNETVSGTTVSSSASGFIITDDGYVITNNHVVSYEMSVPVYRFGMIIGHTTEEGIYTNITANFIESSLNYREEGYTLEVIEVYEEQDLALLKFSAPPANLEPAPFANSGLITMGEEAVIIGNAQGYGLALTSGVVSNPNRLFIDDDDTEPMNVLQTDAALNPGNSGGPVFNIFGEIIGVVSFKVHEEEINEGLGFAVLSNVVMDFIDDVAEEKNISIEYILTERGE